MKKLTYLTVIFCLVLNVQAKQTADVHIINLKTEYTKTPLGMDIRQPRFSWQMKSDRAGCAQTAYRLVVTDESGELMWDSGKMPKDISLNIQYAGKPLQPCTTYAWTVSVWDEKNEKHEAEEESWFETGLMNPDPKLLAWNGAQWIGGGDNTLPFYPDYLPVFKVSCSLQLNKASNSVKAGFIYGANDNRLMNKNKNIYQLENAKDSSYILIMLDIAPLQSGEPALLHVYRVGYSPQDKKGTPLKSFPVPAAIINEQNKYEQHTLYISSMFGDTKISIDSENKENLIGEITLNPIGKGSNYITFPVLASAGFYVPEKQTAYFSDLQVRNYRSPSNILYSDYSSPVQLKGGQKGVSVISNQSKNSMPMLRTTFSAVSRVSKARLYVTARGIYEMYMNGWRISNEYFHPGSTQYDKTHLYQTYDVTDYVVSGKNALGAMLGEGWWSGGSTYMGEYWNTFGDRQSLLAKLVITYSDGKEEIIVTKPSMWKYYNNNPIVYGSFFQGEIYDATKEALVENWASASYDDSRWENAVAIDLDGTTAGNDYSAMKLVGQFGDAVKNVNELTAVAVEEVRPGVFVYDMGQNMAGVPKIRLKGMKAGQKLVLRFAEVKYPDLPEYKENIGMLMLENIRSAMAQDIYIAKGGDEIINPRFTFHGYRYVEITGIDRPLPLEAIKGEVLSSVRELASSYETSNPKVNKLWENITWSMYANFLSIPTDCPQRNERLGWSGDISVFSRTATYLATIPRFLSRHLLAMRDTQRKDGHFPDVAPLDVGFGGLLWGSAGITVAWESYRQYDDKAMLAEHYDAMKQYIRFVLDNYIDAGTNVIVQRRASSDLGDWLSLEDSKNDRSLLWEAYFLFDLEIMQKIAAVLDKQADAEWFGKLYAERKAFFNETYIDKETSKTISSGYKAADKGKVVDTQASYALPLAFHIIDGEQKEKVLKNFIEAIARENYTDNKTLCPPYSLMTGFIGTAWINNALSDNGYTAEAYRLLQQTSYPSWLYPVEQGATTIWERLNSYTHTDGFGGNNSMNSFNHYSFGAVGAWMYAYSLGIRRDENSPGFKHFVLAPEPDPTGAMTYAKGHYDSMYGRIESEWKVQKNECYYYYSVPANTTATLYLSAPDIKNIQTDKSPVLQQKAVYLGKKNGKYAYELKSGVYNITVRK